MLSPRVVAPSAPAPPVELAEPASASAERLARAAKERCPDLLALWAREEQKRKEIAYTGAYVSVDPHENAFNPDGTVNTERHFEKGRVYPEFLKWRPSLDRLPVAATRKRRVSLQRRRRPPPPPMRGRHPPHHHRRPCALQPAAFCHRRRPFSRPSKHLRLVDCESR